MLQRSDELLVRHAQRHRERLEHALGRVGGLLNVVDVLEQEGELVAAEARGGVARAHARCKPLRDLGEHLVAGRVPEAVVDRLEVVEVEEHDRDAAVLAAIARDRVAHALREQCAVGEPGDRVVEGLVRELLLEGLALAHVAAVEDDAADVLVVDEIRAVDLELLRRAVAVHERALHDMRLVPRHRSDVLQQLAHAPAIRDVDELRERPAGDLRRRIAEQPLDRRALVRDRPVRPDDGDQVARMAHERSEASLAAAPVNLFGEGGALECQRHLGGERTQRHADRLLRRRPPGGDE